MTKCKTNNKGGNSPEARRQRAQYMARVGGKFAAGKVAIKAKKKLRPKGAHTKPLENFTAIVLDASGSMLGHTRAASQVVNAQLEAIRRQDAASGQKSIVAIYAFDYNTKLIYQGSPYNYTFTWPNGFGGMTALRDATAEAIKGFAAHEQDYKVDRTFLVYVITDGLENQSRLTTVAELKRLVGQKVATDRWTFGFAVPPGSRHTIANLGIVTENIIEWETTQAGFEYLKQKMDLGYANYTVARASGFKSANTSQVNLFAVDLGGGIKTPKKAWDDLGRIFSTHKVEKEIDIKSFIEGKRGSFAEGIGFYELTKKELVQSHKDLVIIDKADPTKCLVGQDAKQAIGMPLGQDLKVDPFNVSKYKLFVQSTSNNRKLVRGTEVLVRK